VSLLFGLVIVTDLVAIGVALHRRGLIQGIVRGDSVSVDEAVLSDRLYDLTGTGQSLARVAVGVVWLIWFYRAHRNVASYGAQQRFTPGWAIGAWFVPILNLVRPKAITDDIARGSDPAVPFEDWHVTRLRAPGVITLWWFLWIIDQFVSWFLLTRLDDASLESQPDNLVMQIVGAAVDIAAAVSAIFVVRLITSRQQARSRLWLDHGVLSAGGFRSAGSVVPEPSEEASEDPTLPR